MSDIEGLLKAYGEFVALPWETRLAGPQKVWFGLYDPAQERRLRAQVKEFEIATRRAGHEWALCDLTDCLAEWMAGQEYRESYFEAPEDLGSAPLKGFLDDVTKRLRECIEAAGDDANALTAVLGLGSLFGFARSSQIVEGIEGSIGGRLLVFFPGTHSSNNYRMFDARDGWNYHAVPICAL